MSLLRKFRIWWDKQVNWEYYATLDMIKRLNIPEDQIFIIKEDEDGE